MKFTYSDYLKSVGGVAGMSEQQFNEAFGIKIKNDHTPIHLTPKKKIIPIKKEDSPKKSKSAKAPKIKKPKKIKPPKIKKDPYRPQKIYTDEEIKQRRKEARQKKREGFKAQGLTVRGTPRKEPNPPKSIEEIREMRRKYAKTYRENNREKHLESRRRYYDANLKRPRNGTIITKREN